MRSPLTETIQRVQGMVQYVQNNLSTDEYNLFLDLLAPEPEKQQATKRSRKKSGKSRRAASLASAVSGAIQRCTAVVEGSDEPCGEPQGHALHEDKSYASYHPFVSGAQSAGERSSRKSAVVDSAVSSEVETESVLAAGGGD